MVAFIQKAHGCIFFCYAIKAQAAQLAISDRVAKRNLAATALVLAAATAAALIADDADGGNSGVTIVGRASLAVGGGLIN
jgi:hypothetical protein